MIVVFIENKLYLTTSIYLFDIKFIFGIYYNDTFFASEAS